MAARCTTARAHPNIALLKYWGKQSGPGNLPAAPSLSMTLDALATVTSVRDAREDSISLNGRIGEEPRIIRALTDWRCDHDIPPIAISSNNNFPTAAGLASSASGFAALATAINAHCGLGLSDGERSALARRGSASAARSVFGGFVTLAGPDWCGAPLMGRDEWPLQVVIAITATGPKAVSSSEGMSISRSTSPYYDAWLHRTENDFPEICAAVRRRNFAQLAKIAEASCLGMHALMMSSDPALIYWNGATLQCIEAIRALRDGGANVFFTVDAGPQVKAVCEAPYLEQTRTVLAAQPGVHRVTVAGLGGGATVADT